MDGAANEPRLRHGAVAGVLANGVAGQGTGKGGAEAELGGKGAHDILEAARRVHLGDEVADAARVGDGGGEGLGDAVDVRQRQVDARERAANAVAVEHGHVECGTDKQWHHAVGAADLA